MKQAGNKQKKSQAGNIVWSIIALGGMFACGWALCMSLTGCEQAPQKPRFSDAQCAALADKITWSLRDNNAEVAKATQEIFAANCGGYVPAESRPEKVQVENSEPVSQMTVCQEIERVISSAIGDCDEWGGNIDGRVDCYLRNAEVYSTLVQKGCPENAAMNKDLALRQIEIATALQDEADMDNSEVESVIDTYKKLEMQAQAKQVLDKVQKLTDPAIDFILQMEKIINE